MTGPTLLFASFAAAADVEVVLHEFVIVTPAEVALRPGARDGVQFATRARDAFVAALAAEGAPVFWSTTDPTCRPMPPTPLDTARCRGRECRPRDVSERYCGFEGGSIAPAGAAGLLVMASFAPCEDGRWCLEPGPLGRYFESCAAEAPVPPPPPRPPPSIARARSPWAAPEAATWVGQELARQYLRFERE